MYYFLFSIIFYVIIITYFHYKYPELRWNWDNIYTDKISFPASFFWGTATAAHQVEGNCNNNWSEFENGYNAKGLPNIKDNQKSGIACDHWNRFPEDIKLIKKLGVSHYRFSIEWSKIQPEKDKFDLDVLEHYSKMIDQLIDNNIIPVITLHHFTHPIWFDKIGAFEKKENINIFVSFCKRVFDEFSNRVNYWCTINEPGVVAAQGYFMGIFPPGKKNVHMSTIVLKNLLEAHVQVYRTLKKMKNGARAKIGIVKNINQFEPWRRWNILDWGVSSIVNYFFNDLAINFLHTGIFRFWIPGLVCVYHKNLRAINSTDYFGLNYYSHNHLKMQFSITEPFALKYHNQDIMTDMPYTIYGEGIYRAIKFVSKLNIPIIVTENGIADYTDNIRGLFIKRYLYAISKAINDGYDVLGYFYWSLMDNFEWAFGYDMKFGLFSVDYNNQKRSLRNSSKIFIDIIKNNKNK